MQNSNAMNILGTNIRKTRAALGWSQRELAEKSGITYPTISLMENAHHDCTIKTLAKIAGALGVEPGALLFESYDPEEALAVSAA